MQPQPLWQGKAPGAVGDESQDIPTLTAFVPANCTGAAMIVCPGGGYAVVVDHERQPVVDWLNARGIAAFLLVYRVAPRYRHPAMLQDISRAVRTVRAGAAKFKIDPNRIGVIGFSAGGHLAASVAVHHTPGDLTSADPIERVSSRPDLAVLVYPLITMYPSAKKPAPSGNLLGKEPPPAPALIELMSVERQVKPDTPPAFIYHRRGDGTVPVQHAMLYATALAEAGVRFELHVYDHTGHGQVMATNDPIDGDWPERLLNWLRRNGF